MLLQDRRAPRTWAACSARSSPRAGSTRRASRLNRSSRPYMALP